MVAVDRVDSSHARNNGISANLRVDEDISQTAFLVSHQSNEIQFGRESGRLVSFSGGGHKVLALCSASEIISAEWIICPIGLFQLPFKESLPRSLRGRGGREGIDAVACHRAGRRAK